MSLFLSDVSTGSMRWLGGWGNPPMRDEVDFLILDVKMVRLATVGSTLGHQGLLLPPMRKVKAGHHGLDE